MTATNDQVGSTTHEILIDRIRINEHKTDRQDKFGCSTATQDNKTTTPILVPQDRHSAAARRDPVQLPFFLIQSVIQSEVIPLVNPTPVDSVSSQAQSIHLKPEDLEPR